MRTFSKVAVSALLCMTGVPALAAPNVAGNAAPPGDEKASPCLDPAEAEALMLMFAPPLFRSLSQSCKGYLASNSPLGGPNTPFIEAFEKQGDEQLDAAMGGIGKLSGTELPPGLDKKTIKQLFTAFMPKDIVKDITPSKCTAIDSVATTLAPLPPASIARLVISILELAQDGKKESGSASKLAICPAAPH